MQHLDQFRTLSSSDEAPVGSGNIRAQTHVTKTFKVGSNPMMIVHCRKGAGVIRKVASKNTEDSPSFDAQIAILLYLSSNSPYTYYAREKESFHWWRKTAGYLFYQSLRCCPVAAGFTRTVSSSMEVEMHLLGSFHERQSRGSDGSDSDIFAVLSLQRSKTR
ncbi:hypothetical protein MXB_3620 [Myxobolus squamalis]|nr:hypothetical protein MXB_3620 [Myxobolus squamalis]